MPVYDWDEAKRRANFEKHGYDFDDARRIYEHPNVMTVPLDYPGEQRYKDVAEVGGTVLVMVYTMREGKVRVISLRAAKRNERRDYYAKRRP